MHLWRLHAADGFRPLTFDWRRLREGGWKHTPPINGPGGWR